MISTFLKFWMIGNVISWNSVHTLPQRNLRKLLVYRDPLVVQWGCLEYYPAGADHASKREDPEEEPVQNHGDVLPVFNHLEEKKIIYIYYIRVSVTVAFTFGINTYNTALQKKTKKLYSQKGEVGEEKKKQIVLKNIFN